MPCRRRKVCTDKICLAAHLPTIVKFEENHEKAPGGFTCYFALGYEVADHFDISAKVGRSRFNKKDRPIDVNEHNAGLRLAYQF